MNIRRALMSITAIKEVIQTVPVAEEIYEELQQLWMRDALNLLEHSATDAMVLCQKLKLNLAREWITENTLEYGYAQPTGRWRLDTGSPFSGDVVCRRIGTVQTTALTNVPQMVLHHSPSGFEWGYGGSGPSDLALNILNFFLPAKGQDKIECWKGVCSSRAWELHFDFRDAFLVKIPKVGGEISAATIQSWIKNR
jgi:hypothetical protein